jgi:hypothetical protein
MNTVSYHQNVFDLLDVELYGSKDAVALMERWEKQRKSALPCALRDWYSLSGVVHLRSRSPYDEGHLWYDFSPGHPTWPVEGVLARSHPVLLRTSLIPVECLLVATNGRTSRNWRVSLDEEGDPNVWEDGPANPANWRFVGRFSGFVFDWIAGEYPKSDIPRSARPGYSGPVGPWAVRPKRYLNGLWLRAPREPALLPPYIDQLIDALQEEGRQVRETGPTTYRFRLPQARLKITTDHWDRADGHSAWWLHADTPEGLEELVRRVWHIGPLADSLCGHAEPGRQVLQRLKGEQP